jgi:preprotein translocase subunit YajC
MSRVLIIIGVWLIVIPWYLMWRKHKQRRDMESIDAFYRMYVPEENWPEHMKHDQ